MLSASWHFYMSFHTCSHTSFKDFEVTICSPLIPNSIFAFAALYGHHCKYCIYCFKSRSTRARYVSNLTLVLGPESYELTTSK